VLQPALGFGVHGAQAQQTVKGESSSQARAGRLMHLHCLRSSRDRARKSTEQQERAKTKKPLGIFAVSAQRSCHVRASALYCVKLYMYTCAWERALADKYAHSRRPSLLVLHGHIFTTSAYALLKGPGSQGSLQSLFEHTACV
jgi:hypothetical protein